MANRRSILDYWSLVEFFTPYRLDSILQNPSKVVRVYVEDLEEDKLPWTNLEALGETSPVDPMTPHYNLYLGLFSTEETADRARHFFSQKESSWESTPWRLCGDEASWTCFARLSLGYFGTPLFGSLSISSLPWAHGTLETHRTDQLRSELFWKGVNRFLSGLKEELRPNLPERLVKKPDQKVRYLDGEAISLLCGHLFEWAGYAPKAYPIALIQGIEGTPGRISADLPESEKDLPILNSFFIQDLEAAQHTVDCNESTPLSLYLGGKRGGRTELDASGFSNSFREQLHPCKTSLGIWPGPPERSMATMQQYAINTALEELEDGGLFSINGPPGTGKTTLLRELVAEVVVSRATRLAKLATVQEAFGDKRRVSFGDNYTVSIREIAPSLTGFEMVIASSNNNAVENISRELPLQSAISGSPVPASYLKSVANWVLGDGSKESCWGLISVALGNSTNCRQFVSKAFFNSPDQSKGEENGSELNLWSWVDRYDGPSFKEVQKTFLEHLDEHQDLVNTLEELATLHQTISSVNREEYIQEELAEYYQLLSEKALLEEQGQALRSKQVRTQAGLERLNEMIGLWKTKAPSLWQRVKKSTEWLKWEEKQRSLTDQKFEMLEEEQQLENDLQELKIELKEVDELLELVPSDADRVGQKYDEMLESYVELSHVHCDFRLPEQNVDLDSLDGQQCAPYQSGQLNHSRSKLFSLALALQEAWLAEALRPGGGLRGNLLAVQHLLNGKTPTTTDDLLIVWQSLFLVVPTVSTTFASVGRLFRYLEPESLGWLFIDEAGQALPQATVGAIWRCQRVLAMGDPMQIEPISSVTAEVVDGLARHKLNDKTLEWSPSRISAQILLDQATPYGVYRALEDELRWVATPLRVHRRCEEPMFSISNRIAYADNMLLASETDENFELPSSCWFHVQGEAQHRQYVPKQGLFLLARLKELLKEYPKTSPYVISPFREVVLHLKRLLYQDQDFNRIMELAGVSRNQLGSWLNAHVGTVHTFQGKQSDIVFMVLGADTTTEGAVRWASSKPNLLNVAVTRSRRRFYMIGCADLWKRHAHFLTAAELLPLKTAWALTEQTGLQNTYSQA